MRDMPLAFICCARGAMFPVVRSAVLELVAQVAHTTTANLAHSISHAPVDQAFTPQASPATAA